MYFFYKIVLLLCMCGGVFQFSVFAIEDRSYQLNIDAGRDTRVEKVNNAPFLRRIDGLAPDPDVENMRNRAWGFYRGSGNVLTARLYFDNNHQGVFGDDNGRDIAPFTSLYPGQHRQIKEQVFTSGGVVKKDPNNYYSTSLYDALHRLLYDQDNRNRYTYTDTEMVAVCALLGVAIEDNYPSEIAERSKLKYHLLKTVKKRTADRNLRDAVDDGSVNRMIFVLYSRLDPCRRCSTLLRDFANTMNDPFLRTPLFTRLYGRAIADRLTPKLGDNFHFYVEVISDQPYCDSALAGLDRVFLESIHNHFANEPIPIANNNDVVCRRYDWSSYVKLQE